MWTSSFYRIRTPFMTLISISRRKSMCFAFFSYHHEEISLVIIQIFYFLTWINYNVGKFSSFRDRGICCTYCALTCKRFVNKIEILLSFRCSERRKRRPFFFGSIFGTCRSANHSVKRNERVKQENNPITILRNIRLYWFARSIFSTEWT